jgi:hypothetical protein
MDEDCAVDHVCWYTTAARAKSSKKECIKMYDAPDFSEFGYKKDPEMEFKYNMLENMKYGRVCKSGMVAITEADNKMQCV